MTETFDEKPVDFKMRRDLMKRVGYIHTMRRVLHPEMVKGIVFVASVTGVTLMIHIEQVISNMATLGSYTSYPGYLYGAFVQTSLPVQTIIVLGLAAGGWMAFDIAYHSKLAVRFHLRAA